MKPAPQSRQRGVALLAMIAIVVMVFAYMLVSHLNAASGFRPANVGHNSKVLHQARQALIGYVAQRTALGDDPATAGTVEARNPGSLPCPEAPGNFGTSNEGIAAAACAAPAVGRLPWRTLGLDKLTDAAGEPLWYAVSPGWHLPNTSASTIINSNSVGQLNVDGVANDSVALIIAPGPAMSTQASAGCTARSQAHPQTAGSLDRADYLECENAAGAAFVTSRSSGDFNDQALRITVADIMPAIEAAIAVRIEREIVPQLRSVYASSTWGTNVTPANPIYPFPAPFADPAAAASFNGSAASCDVGTGVCRGLLPMRFNNAPGSTAVCSTVVDGPLCDPTFVRWQSGTIQVESLTMPLLGNISPGVLLPGLLTWTPTPSACAPPNFGNSPHTLDCTLYSPGLLGFLATNVNYRIDGVVQNVGMAMRRFDPAAALPGVTTTAAPTISTMTSAGAVTIQIRGQTNPTSGLNLNTALCGLVGIIPGFTLGCQDATVSVPMTLLPDHTLLNANDATVGWFFRNEWYRLMYYATSRSTTPAILPAGTPACTPGTDCLTVNNLSAANDKRALLLLTGRNLTAAPRTSNLDGYLDSVENQNLDRTFEKRPVNRSFNDRVIVVGTN
jgi:hypothetical protein